MADPRNQSDLAGEDDSNGKAASSVPAPILPSGGTAESDVDRRLVGSGRREAPQPGILLAVVWAVTLPLGQAFLTLILAVNLATLVVAWMTREEADHFLANQLHSLQLALSSTATVAISFGICAILFGRSLVRATAWRRCSWSQCLLTVMLVLPLLIISGEIANWAEEAMSALELPWLSAARKAARESYTQINRLPWLAVLLFGCLLPGIGEELYCRGFIGRGLVGRYGVVSGTLITSLLFGAMHVLPAQACSAFFLGIGLHVVFLSTRSLPAAILLHALHNSIVFCLWRYSEQVVAPSFTGGPEGAVTHTPWLLTATSLASAALLMNLLIRTRTRWSLPDGTWWTPGYVTAETPPPELRAVALQQRITMPALVFTALVYGAMLVTLPLAIQLNR